MASITASSYEVGVAQADGRVWVRFLFNLVDGTIRSTDRLADALEDHAAALSAAGTALTTALANVEIAKNIIEVETLGINATPTFVFSTASQNASAIRTAYADMTEAEAAFTGEYLNSLTDAQLRNAFNLTQAQVTNLRTNKLQPAATLAAQIRSTTGA